MVPEVTHGPQYETQQKLTTQSIDYSVPVQGAKLWLCRRKRTGTRSLLQTWSDTTPQYRHTKTRGNPTSSCHINHQPSPNIPPPRKCVPYPHSSSRPPTYAPKPTHPCTDRHTHTCLLLSDPLWLSSVFCSSCPPPECASAQFFRSLLLKPDTPHSVLH